MFTSVYRVVKRFFTKEMTAAINPTTLKEGKAEILVGSDSRVFYNPVQEFNRDLSVNVLSLYATELNPSSVRRKRNAKGAVIERPHQLRVLEALSATGLRSIRFALEVPNIEEIIANDLSSQAVESIEANVKHNNVAHLVKTSNNDASLLMHMQKSTSKRFDVVDLDPYGCPSRFLDATVQVLEEGGLMMVTATDMAVLAGNSPETCYAKYGAISLRSSACHEMALRILLQCIESHANRYGRYIHPLLSISADFYIRVFAQIFTSPATCKRTTSKLDLVYQCVGCKSSVFHPLGVTIERENVPNFKLPRVSPDLSKCPHCGHSYQVGGPIWSGPLHDHDFVSKLIESVERRLNEFKTSKRIIGMATLALNELNVPLYYSVDSLCATVHCEVIPLVVFRSALLHAGFQVSESHAAANSIKTTAPTAFVWDVVRRWIATGHSVSRKRLEDSEVTRNIIEKKENADVNFEIHPEAQSPTQGLLRYQVNPLPNWGPGMRSLNNAVDVAKVKKSKARQNRKKIPTENP